jgi:hypothetical protein
MFWAGSGQESDSPLLIDIKGIPLPLTGSRGIRFMVAGLLILTHQVAMGYDRVLGGPGYFSYSKMPLG